MKFSLPIMNEPMSTLARWAAELRRVPLVTEPDPVGGIEWKDGDTLIYDKTAQGGWIRSENQNMVPFVGAGGAMTFTGVTVVYYRWRYVGASRIELDFYITGTTGGVANTSIVVSSPFNIAANGRPAGSDSQWRPCYIEDAAGREIGFVCGVVGTTSLRITKATPVNWGLGANRYVIVCAVFEVDLNLE